MIGQVDRVDRQRRGAAHVALQAFDEGLLLGPVNPAMAEMLNMICFHVIGHDAAITMCGEAGSSRST